MKIQNYLLYFSVIILNMFLMGCEKDSDFSSVLSIALSIKVNGACHEITHYQCLNGTTPDNRREENGFYRWSCLGLNGGDDIHTCSQVMPPVPVHGECDETTYYQCLNDTIPNNTREDSGFYKWSCLGLNGGNDMHTCSQMIPLVPVHGECDGTTYYQCLNDTIPNNKREDSGFYKWSCLGLNGGNDIHTCNQMIPLVPVHGQCDETIYYQCLNGTTPDNTREDSGFYKWSCLGFNGGDDIHTCSQVIPLVPVHGQCDEVRHYRCLKGTIPDNTRKGSRFYRWSCLGLNGGNNIHTCNQAIPLGGLVHGQCDETRHYRCFNGTIPDNTRENSGFYKWSCLGLNGGDDIHTCSQAIPTEGPVHGECDGTIHYQCLNGTTPDNTREDSGFYKWSCLGINGGDDIHTCSLPITDIQHHSFEVTQTSSKFVDILVVIDNSGSMDEYQRKLANGFGDLSSHLGGVDWQMAFINTDTCPNTEPVEYAVDDDPYDCLAATEEQLKMDGNRGTFYNLEEWIGDEFVHNGAKIQILKSSMPNAQDLFEHTIDREEEGAGAEYHFTNIINAIRRPENQRFFRNDVALAVIILTDEGEDAKTPEDLITAVRDQFGNNKRFFGYGIVCKEPKLCLHHSFHNNTRFLNYILNVRKLARLTGGIVEDITATDYSPILQNISSNLRTFLNLKEVILQHTNVIPKSISLTFTPSAHKVKWRFEASTNKIIFEKIPPDQTRIQINYSYQIPL